MLEDRIVYLRGELVPWDKATVHIMSHSMGRGTAIFEVLSFHETESGPAVFRLDEHAKRLAGSANFLGIELPLTVEGIIEAVRETVKANKLTEGFIKIISFFSSPSFSVLPPEEKLDISIFVVNADKDLDRKPVAEEGATLCIPKWRKLDPQTVPVEAKASANYLNGMLSRMEAVKRGFDYAVMLDTQGFVAEGGTESVFIVKENKLMTPACGTVLRSVSRKSLLALADVVDIEASEERIRPSDLLEADEVFLASTEARVRPVKKVEERTFENIPGPISRKLGALIHGIEAGKDDRFRDWLFPCPF